jgi:Mg-chelatase subunit ChlD
MPIEKFNKPSLVKGHKIGMSEFQSQMRKGLEQKEVREAQELGLMPNRIGMMLDLSGSMESYVGREAKTKLSYLRDAVEGFTNTLNPQDTSLAIETFPMEETLSLAPTNDSMTILLHLSKLDHTIGATPLGATMEAVLGNLSITRGIIVSDGQQTDGELCFRVAADFAEAGIPVDCVHIGEATYGEETLQQIAKITGGLFIKFDNVANFGKNFKFLTPGFRGYLTSGDAAGLLGAKEVK